MPWPPAECLDSFKIDIWQHVLNTFLGGITCHKGRFLSCPEVEHNWKAFKVFVRHWTLLFSVLDYQAAPKSFTSVHFLLSPAFLAFDGAAPMKSTLAIFFYDHFSHSCSPATAQKLTSAYFPRSIVAPPAHSSMRTVIRVCFAKVWGLCRVHQIKFCVRFYC